MGRAHNRAAKFLREYFARNRDAPAARVDAAAADNGISRRTLCRAKSQLGIVSKKTRQGWVWHLPAQDDTNLDGLVVIRASDVTLD
jgi:hypothetical protein